MAGIRGAASARQIHFDETSLDACGCALTAMAEEILSSETAACRLWGQLAAAVAARVPVSLRITGLGPERHAASVYEAFCERLAIAFRRSGMSPADIGLSVQVPTIDPCFAWDVRRSVLGEGELNLVFSTTRIRASSADEHECDERFWQQLWRLRNIQPVVTAFWPQVTSRCPLFSSESAVDVLPLLRLQVPSQTAWLSADVELPEFVDAAGKFDAAALAYELNRLIDSSEHMYDVHAWPTPSMQQDAWLHRRLAICLNGVGDFVCRLGLDPDRHASLRVLQRLLLRIRNLMQGRSRQLAQANESLPSIIDTNPCRSLPAGNARTAWEKRWVRAVEQSAVRHRNLLVMSPWSLFPAAEPDVRYMNLIPLLHHADACRFNRELSIDSWNVNEFKRFHQRAAAVMHSLQADGLVAEQL